MNVETNSFGQIDTQWTTVFLLTFVILASGCFSQPDRSVRLKQLSGSDNIGLDDAEKRCKWKKRYVYVTRVIDGDMFWVDNGTTEFKVRFIGIDALETRNAGRKKKGRFGEEGKEYVTRLTEHQWVRLEMDVQEKDRYQRVLAYVYLEDGTFLNANLVANGYAVVDTHPPNVKYADLFVKLQCDARELKLGLWAKSPTAPP